MTNLEKEALDTLANRIEHLASLENARFSFDKEEDEKIKKKIKPYMQWFNAVANDIRDVVEISNETGFIKKEKLEEIIRLNV